ncbi:MAG: DUF4168 domain-containing protein [Gemmatimonadetes bacterium]|nr:DUF4168 domain-containing protein [Gemmatimonadota bacterium]
MGVRRLLCPAIAAAAMLTIVPARLASQTPPDSATVTVDQLTAYARAWVAIGATRDDIQAQLAMAKNKTAEAQKALRDTLRARVAQLVREHGMSEAEYRRITFIVSTDAELRKQFEEIVEQLPRKEGGGHA